MRFAFFRRLVVAGLAWAMAVALHAAPPKWTRVESPYFTLYLEGSEKQALAWAEDLEVFRRTCRLMLGVPLTQLRPALVVVFRNDRGLRPFKPLRDGKPTEVTSFSYNHGALFTAIGTSLDASSGDGRNSLFHGGTHWLLSGFPDRGPDWLQTGLAEVLSTFELRPDKFRLGEADQNAAIYIARKGVQPLDQFFATQTDRLAYRGDAETSRFHAQSWVLVHYLLFSRQHTKSSKLGELLERLQLGEGAAEAMPAVFGRTAQQFQADLDRYVQSGRYYIYSGTPFREGIDRELTAGPASAVEVEIAQGYLMLMQDRMDEARACFGRADIASPDEPRVHTAWGDVAVVTQASAEALRRYELASAAGSRDFRVHFALGEALLRSGSGIAGGVPRFEALAARRAANHFERAVNFHPFYVPAYEHLAALMPSLEKLGPEDRRFLERGLNVSADNPLLLAGLGLCQVKTGEPEAGLARLTQIAALDARKAPLAVAIAREHLARAGIGAEIKETREALARGAIEEAARLLSNLLELPEAAPHRAELLELRRQLTRHQLLARARAHAEAGRTSEAELVLDELLDDPGVDEAMRADAAAVRQAARDRQHQL